MPGHPANAGNTRSSNRAKNGEATVQGQEALNWLLRDEIAAFERFKDPAEQQLTALGGPIVAGPAPIPVAEAATRNFTSFFAPEPAPSSSPLSYHIYFDVLSASLIIGRKLGVQ
ncbi:unnamed protein product [Clonostachys solani]|uniref:Uncharacterized protein n=1 Tax=Clonostachys solani TaxID=160281 RepID=A0A9P0EQ39_9HYPO|nr:unnamed protein product [Clonostachys solani]